MTMHFPFQKEEIALGEVSMFMIPNKTVNHMQPALKHNPIFF